MQWLYTNEILYTNKLECVALISTKNLDDMGWDSQLLAEFAVYGWNTFPNFLLLVFFLVESRNSCTFLSKA